MELEAVEEQPARTSIKSKEAEDKVKEAYKSGLAAVYFKHLIWTRKDIHLTVLFSTQKNWILYLCINLGPWSQCLQII